MQVTANQSVQLLWLHHCDMTSHIALSYSEVKHLELELVAKYGDLTESVYTSKLLPDTKDELVEYLLKNSGKTLFKQD